MNRRNIHATLVSAAIALLPQVAGADTVYNAFRFCSALDGTGLLSRPCKVSGWSQAFNVSSDTTSSDARDSCAGIVAQASQVGAHFDKGWKVRIYSPYSNGNTIAQCCF
jgi:hypothetical protein